MNHLTQSELKKEIAGIQQMQNDLHDRLSALDNLLLGINNRIDGIILSTEYNHPSPTTIQELKPFVQKICDEIISSVKLYIEDMSEDEMVNNVYLDSEYKVQFSINYEKILKQVADAKTDNFNYIFDREVFEMAAAIKKTEIFLSHSNILL